MVSKIGTNGPDTLIGTELGDTLLGLNGDDTLKGLGGNDTLMGGEGADILNGGSGIDTADYLDSNTGVLVSLAADLGSGGAADFDTFVSIENMFGSNFNDILEGNDVANTLIGGLGDDTLKGFGGADQLFGSTGADTLFGGAGNDRLVGDNGDDADRLVGGADSDTYVVDDGDIIDESVAGSSGIDLVESLGSFSLSSPNVRGAVENLTLTGAGDFFGIGNALDNVIDGNSGDNFLNGNSGADRMIGERGDDSYVVNETGDIVDEGSNGLGDDDILSFISLSLSGPQVRGSVENLRLASGTAPVNAAGNELDNVLTGNRAKNDLMGLGGDDTLTGSAGADTFVFNAALNAATNVDTITDFSVLFDTIRLENAFMQGLNTGTLKASAFRIGASAADASDRIVYNDDTGDLFFDRDGAGGAAAIRFAELDTDLAMTNQDFFVI